MRRALKVALACGCVGIVALTVRPIVAAAPATGGGFQILDFKPGLDDLMNMMVQPRHTKLYLAAKQRNWELAAFQSDELRAAFRRIGQTIPRYRGQQIDEVVAALMAPRLDDIDQAIKARDIRAFSKSFDDLTVACNGCHQAMDHPFLVMKVPDGNGAALYPDQDLRPRR